MLPLNDTKKTGKRKAEENRRHRRSADCVIDDRRPVGAMKQRTVEHGAGNTSVTENEI